MRKDQHPERKENHCVWRVVGEEVIILSDHSRKIHVLNEVAAEIWKLCDGTKSLKDIVSVITEEFDVDTETADRDVTEFIENMCRLNLLVLREKANEQ